MYDAVDTYYAPIGKKKTLEKKNWKKKELKPITN